MESPTGYSSSLIWVAATAVSILIRYQVPFHPYHPEGHLVSSIQDSDRKVAALGSDSKKDERGQGFGLVFLDLETGDLFYFFWDTAIRSLTASWPVKKMMVRR